jgi:hypothetical protein
VSVLKQSKTLLNSLCVSDTYLMRVEATMFALLMSLGNFGHDISSYIGAIVSVCAINVPVHHALNHLLVTLFSILQDELGIGNPDYHYLPHMIVVKSMLRILPLIMIPLLVPDGCPQDDEAVETKLSPAASGAHSLSSSFFPTGSFAVGDVEMTDVSLSSSSSDMDASHTPLTTPSTWMQRFPINHASVPTALPGTHLPHPINHLKRAFVCVWFCVMFIYMVVVF